MTKTMSKSHNCESSSLWYCLLFCINLCFSAHFKSGRFDGSRSSSLVMNSFASFDRAGSLGNVNVGN